MKDRSKLTQWFYQYSTLFLLIVPLLVLAISDRSGA